MAVLYADAQCTQPYKAFNQFANDTTAFLRYNFKTRADCYKGKTVADVLKDLQLTPKMFISKSSTRVNKYAGICISNTTMLDILQDPGRKTQSIYMYCTDFMYDTEKSKLRRTYDNGGVWIQPYYDFFKNRIVGEVEYL